MWKEKLLQRDQDARLLSIQAMPSALAPRISCTWLTA